MAEITTTQSFSDGDTVTATKLNNIQANSSIQPEVITNKSVETTVDQANDLLLMYDASATSLKKVAVSNIVKAGTASDFPVTGNATIGGTLGVTGNVSVNTNKFNVTAASGNTLVAGTLGVADTISVTRASGTGLAVTSDVTFGGTLAVTGAITATSTINGTTIPATKTLVTTTDTQTLTNKTLTTPIISSISNTGTITLPASTDTLVGRATTDTLTNKTLTSPIISSISNTGTLTLPTSTDTLVGRATTDTLTNKTLTSPVIATITNTGTITLPTSTDTLVGRATTDTLTNKTLTSPAISGGTINNATIGATTASSASFTTIAASGLITASGGVTGNVTGNCTGSSGSCSGNSATATTASACSGNSATATSAATLTTARTINGISFNGSANIVTNPSTGAYSNGYGARTVQSGGTATGGSDGDIIYIY